MINVTLASLKILAASSSAFTACPGGGPTADSSCNTGLPKVSAGASELHTLLTIFFGIMAVLAVLFVVIGGLRFVTSAGDPQAAHKARDTIIYAIVGLVIAILAEALVSLVLGKV